MSRPPLVFTSPSDARSRRWRAPAPDDYPWRRARANAARRPPGRAPQADGGDRPARPLPVPRPPAALAAMQAADDRADQARDESHDDRVPAVTGSTRAGQRQPADHDTGQSDHCGRGRNEPPRADLVTSGRDVRARRRGQQGETKHGGSFGRARCPGRRPRSSSRARVSWVGRRHRIRGWA